MKKLFLSVIAMLCCGLAWSQTTWSGSGTEADPYLIQDTNDFKAIDNGISGNFYAGKYFKQEADLNFGNMGTKEQSFIRIFAGNYDGNGKSISYNGTFTGQQHSNHPDDHYTDNGHGDYGLFGRVTNGGTIKNLNVNAQILFTAKEGVGNDNMNAGLLCGHLDNGTISYCNVTGEVASQINANNGGGGDVGLLCGQSEGREEYCSGSGTVTGYGWVGGLIGAQHKGSIYACSFEGAVKAFTPRGNSCTNTDGLQNGWGSFAGGIVGMTGCTGNQQGQTVQVDVSFCVANADVSAGCVASGVASLAVGGGSATVTNCIGSGTVNGSTVTKDVTNSTNSNNNNTTNGKTEEEIQEIIDNLNQAANGTGMEFGNSNGNIIIYPEGKPEEPCAVPTNLVITKTESRVSASWEGSASEYETRLTGGDLTGEQTSTVTNASWSKTSLPASPNEYVFSVRAKCPEKTKEENKQSDWVSSSFTIDCPKVSNLQMQEKTSNSLTIKWETTTNDLKLTLKKGETEIRSIKTGLSSPYKITDLDANTAYTISLSAKCGENYVNPQQIRLTTNKPSVPQNLKAEPYYDGTQNKGKVTIQWDAVAETGEYEYELSGSKKNADETLTPIVTVTATVSDTSFTKDPYDLGTYSIKVRSKQGGTYSDWSNTLNFVISSPLAPKNPKTTFAVNQDDNGKKDVIVSWEAGNTASIGWEINGVPVSNPSYTLPAQEPGSRLNVSIVENIVGGKSDALTFYIDVPCLDMAAPNISNITQTSATINGLASDDKIYLNGSEKATATANTYSFSDLLPGTHYDVEVRRYCNGDNGIYSAQSVAFTTYACYKPKNLSSPNISTTSATIKWERGNANLGDLTFELKLFKDGETTDVQTIRDINGTTYTFNTLLPGTSYKVSIAEKCQDGYGEPVSHTFTTKAGNFVAVNTGQWSSTSTWKNGQIPTDNEANIIINPDVNVILGSGTLKLTDTYTLTNNGTLELTTSSQIINLSEHNDLGKVNLPAAGEQGKWSLIGAPFASEYKLEAIVPDKADVAVVLYDYTTGKWKTDWATVTNIVQQGEAFFAWPFYSGNITLSTKLESSTETGYLLNNGYVTVSKNIVNSEGGNWLPLVNPYPAILSAKKFTAGINGLQGKGVYLYTTNTGKFEYKDLTSTDVEIGLCTGFFINFSSAGDKSVTFKKEHLRDWPTTTAKSCCKSSSREVVEIDLEHNYINVPLYFVHNLEAEQGYDIWDANKLFSTSGIPEPYFVTEGVNLVKEEVNELPYYATVNIRSEKDTVVTLIAKTIPEGYAVSLIDGEQETDLNEGGRYPIEITTGENADRFKLLVKKNVGLEEVANTDIKISNNNRHITITAQDKVKVSVYNALGQKVYETAKSIFTLEGVAAGAYVIKVQSGKAVQSQKVIIR